MSELPRPSTSWTIDDTQADALWNWTLDRQGLAEHTRMNDVAAIAEAALGLHSARLPSPFATVAARASSPRVPLSLFDAATRTTLLTVRCMRKTLHTLPLPLAAVAHVATVHFRERDAIRQVTNAGIELAVIERTIETLAAMLAESGPLFHRTIEARLGRDGVGVGTARLAIKLAWERGVIAYLNQTSGWNREARTFDLTASAYPGLALDLSREQATATLIEAYFDRYGPATIRDATWWSALSAGAITNALAATGRDLVELRTPWAEDPAFMFRDRFEQFVELDDTGASGRLSFLAHEDIALKAFFQTRTRYLGGLPQAAVFNQIGEVLPTIMIGGRLIGTWAWNEAAQRAEPALAAGISIPPRLLKKIRDYADQLSETLRRGRSNSYGSSGTRQPNEHQDELALTW